jgi:putative spermidine/putrescine transport system ATP-binding protein
VLSPAFTKAAGGPERWASLRPEKITILRGEVPVPAGQLKTLVTVKAVHYQGASTRLNTATAEGHQVNVTAPSSFGKVAEGEVLTLHWGGNAFHVMEGER